MGEWVSKYINEQVWIHSPFLGVAGMLKSRMFVHHRLQLSPLPCCIGALDPGTRITETSYHNVKTGSLYR